MKTIWSWLLPLFVLLLGLGVMGAVFYYSPSPGVMTLGTLVAFIFYNVFIANLLRLDHRLWAAWSLRKVWHFGPGFLLGLIPVGVAYIWLTFAGALAPFRGISLVGLLLTLATVGWEELWFRGIAFELGVKRYSAFGAIFLFALIFVALHTLNPQANLLYDGLPLFLAGYSLGAAYLAFGSIWVCVGMHFSNNLVQALFGERMEPRTIFYTGPLLLLAIALTFALRRRQAYAPAAPGREEEPLKPEAASP